ncbi:XrtA/PEP-CTERM system exopolysaccharide export protein [Plasticicumulans sp.]|uniref:XrtA/PEP-CTERM system exopolysaccharide export protein n=1 Tax=Plasticicumulans sp. TaxID=2307179 RepID=UPI002CB4F4ED|nr:XrtA/PEP-CTERM system exopolysaccharide export protein [Plasticicumulans sp.]HMV37929.1 polysaccharide export protein [Plasticicumulans sp.]HMW29883.1 polysaccharide export protein [Plasticicumulans sp.]HMW41369.1 polysaccharide export protein [Plasticicumulans sp.]HMX52473.1 polysaccharide export protein [Plasticicumulans sp.]HMZ09816.1 polysaccharide export protein [Plasticicumulans sp.]
MIHVLAVPCRVCMVLVLASLAVLAGCSSTELPTLPTTGNYGTQTTDPSKYNYIIGPGDSVQIFVWRNPEVSQSVTVRPDGKITTPLVEDLQASGRTPTQLARDIEKVLETYIRQPIVTVIMGGFGGPYSEQIRVVGEAAKPQSIPYREKMSLLDVMILVGGLTQFADGNEAKIVRVVEGQQQQYRVRIDDLLKDGDITANVDMLPGDILIVPESWL